ncbi:MAG: 4-alpha-glucanotransferase, partial [Chitinophagaceae bacterium]
IKKGLEQEVYDMQFGDPAKWLLNLELNRSEFPNDEIVYSYYFKGLHGDKKYEGGLWRKLNISFLKYEKISIVDQWNDAGDVRNIYNTPVFQQPHLNKEGKFKALKLKANSTHIFTINVPSLPLNTQLCLLGNCAAAGSWTISKKLFLTAADENNYLLQMKLSPEDFPFEYKYALYDTVKNSLLQFENGENRGIEKMDEAIFQFVHDGFANFRYEEKKRVGISIPVFSLRSENSGGVGEFNDLKLLGAWAEKTGIQLIQILPVNDTTSTGSWEDSYPYSAISAFALHPIYMNLQTMAGKKYAVLAEKYATELKSYNELQEVSYPEVNRIKWNFFKEIFPLQKKQIFSSKKYQEFFDKNKYWLEPYAVFCFLRDKNKTADFYTWKAYKKYSVAALNKILKTKGEEISIHFFLQFHLHVQLLDAVMYLKKKGISLKGDLPIGIKGASADHWQNPELFNDNLLAGAPPDAFTEAGQNWGFPTYNWKAMKENNYRWWEAKLNHSSTYAAAIRLDHVLGFFRIWSIPKENTQGILGYFQPSIALHVNDFTKKNIYFDEDRFCSPFITEKLVEEIFLEESGYVKDFFLHENVPGYFEFKEAFNTQKKLQEFILKRDDSAQSKKLLNKLLYLHSEIILLKDKDNGFHFPVNMQYTFSFNALDEDAKNKLNALYHEYFFSWQNELWKRNGKEILSALHKTTNLLYCGEDLGWAPAFVPAVLKENGILSLEVQRMPKKSDALFTDLSIV